MKDVFLRRFLYDVKAGSRIVSKRTGIFVPILCLGCGKVWNTELYAKVMVTPPPVEDEAIVEIVSPTNSHPFRCDNCAPKLKDEFPDNDQI